jgi:dual specificity phosphatase 3
MSSLLSVDRPRRPESPATIWRQICWVNDQLAVSGDLPYNRTAAEAQLRMWEAEGITDVFDMRGEADDSAFIHTNSQQITSHWFGVDDNGGKRSDSWFAMFVTKARQILQDPTRKVLVHCHMGVNRGPSALFAVMVATGWNHLDALRQIRNARPIAGLIYAPDAVRWFALNELGVDELAADDMHNEVVDWLERNDLDIAYVIRSIGSQLA